MKESETLFISKKRQEMIARGLDVVSLGLGEPHYPTPPHIVEYAVAQLRSGQYFSYPPVAGYADLRAVIADKFTQENALSAAPEEIVVSTGAEQCIANVLLALLDPGDEVVIFSPYWVNYPRLVHFAGGVPVYLRTTVQDNYTPSAEALASVLTPKTKLLMFSSPCNPTGAVFRADSFQAWAEVLAAYPDVFVLSDEIYEHVNFTGRRHESIGSLEALQGRVVTINGVSKGFSMMGWRLGYMHAPRPLAQACEKIQSQLTGAASGFSQRACLHALVAEKTACQKMRDDYARKCVSLASYIEKQLPKMTLNRPQGAYYLLPDVSYYLTKSHRGRPIGTASTLCQYLLEEALVSVVPGSDFGAPEAIRISFSVPDRALKEGFRRLKEGLMALA